MLLVDIKDQVALVTLNRPEACNAMSLQMVAELQQALEAAEATAGSDGAVRVVRVVVLRGEAGARQVAGAKIGLTHVLGFGNGSAAGVHIFEKA